jgi:hypothetical protein
MLKRISGGRAIRCAGIVSVFNVYGASVSVNVYGVIVSVSVSVNVCSVSVDVCDCGEAWSNGNLGQVETELRVSPPCGGCE